MKKKYLLILFVLTSIIGINKVSAIYNGGSVSGGSSLHGSCPNNTKKYCLYNNNFKNPVHETVKITLYYFNESGSRIQVGNSIYATNKISGIRNAGLSVNGIIEDKNISRKSSQLEAYLLQDAVFDKYLSYLGVSRGELTLKSEKAPNGKYGYRFIIEPAFTAYRQNVMYLVTTKEIAEYDKMNSSVSWTSLSSVMYLEYNDVGITAGNSKGTSDINAAKNINNGWGYNIVDVSGKTTTEACEWKTATSCCHEKNSLTGTALANFKTQHPACFPQETPPKPTCDFSLKTSIPNNCETSSDGYVKDTEDWSCIFMSTLASGQVDKFGDLYSIAQEYQKISSHFYKWQNNYCAVYCREWVEYHLPENNLSVLAGTHFVLGNQHISKLPTNFSLPRLKPITFVGRSECRVTREKSNKNDTSINYDKFQTDFAKADEKVKKAWDDWQIAIKKDEAIAGSTNVSSSNDCNWTCDSKDEETGSCVSGSYKNHRKNPKTVFYNDGSGNKNVTPNSYCDSSKPKYVKNHKTLYDNTVAARNAIVKQIKDCNNFVMKNEIFEPSLDFDYTEPIYGRSVQDLDYDLNINIQTDYFNSNSKVGTYRREDVNFNRFSELSENSDFVTTSNINGASSKINSWNCSNKGQTCSLTTTTYPSNSWLKQWTTKTYDYKLPSGIYQNISKPSGESYKYASEVGGNLKNSVAVLYSNLPVHYSTKEGRYNYQIQFNTFGTKSTTLKHKFDYYIFEGGKVDITYGENFDVYYIMLNKTNLSSRLQHCGAADHLGHGTAEQLQKEGILNQFLQSACATQHNCKSDGYNITCTRYKDSNGLWRYYNPGWTTTNSYTTYRQLRECIESNVIKTEGKVVFDGSTTYKCTYKVKNEIMRECDTPSCKPNDLNVIFRTISLNNPFPGQSGNGRAPGDNWNKTSLVNSFITNNRGVQTENLYKDRSPLYSITLTPALIKQIRNYNDKLDTKRVSYYTTKSGRIDGIAGYSDFDLDCNANGKNCKSNFIRNSVENYDFSKYFSGCGINGKAHGLKCNSSDSW